MATTWPINTGRSEHRAALPVGGALEPAYAAEFFDCRMRFKRQLRRLDLPREADRGPTGKSASRLLAEHEPMSAASLTLLPTTTVEADHHEWLFSNRENDKDHARHRKSL